MTILQPLVGLAALIALAWALSEDRRAFSWRWAGGAVLLQIVLAALFLRIEILRQILAAAGEAVSALERATRAGTSLMFGYLGGGAFPFEVTDQAATLVIAFQILPIILVTAALAAILWHWRLLPLATQGMAWLLQRSLGIGGAAGLGTAANFFLGVVESPLVIRPYLARMARAELFMVMVAGMATLSGTVLVLYAAILGPVVEDAAAHILTASLISLPAALLFARVLVPGDGTVTAAADPQNAIQYDSTLAALATGVEDGLRVFLSVVAMLVVIFALVHLADEILGLLPDVAGTPLSVNRVFGWLFTPLVLAFGVPWEDAAIAGQLMGTKAILNEFISFQALAAMEPGTISPRSATIMTYALCGFANLSSIGLQIAALGVLVPERRAEIAGLGLKSWLAGNLATGATAACAAVVLPA